MQVAKILTMPLNFDKPQTLKWLDTVIFYSLLGFVLTFSFSLGLLNTFLYSAVVLYIIKSCLTRQFFPEIKYLKFVFLGILGVVLISLLNVPHEFLHMSFRGLKKICIYMIFSIVIINSINTKEKIQKIFLILSLGLIISSIDTLFQYTFGYDLFRKYPLYYEAKYTGYDIFRATAAYPHPNHLGVYLSTFFFILILYALTAKTLFKKILLLVSGFLCGLATFFTFSRGAALAMVMTCILTFSLCRKKEIFLLFISVAITGLFFLPQDIKLFLKNSPSINTVFFGLKTKENPNPTQHKYATTDRRDLWKTAVNMFKKHPFVGVGFYSFSDQYVFYKNKTDPNSNIRAHSGFFEILAELGIIGFGLFIFLFCYALYYSFHNYSKISDNFLRFSSLGLFLASISFLMNTTYESTMRSARIAPFFWLILGLILCHKKITQNEF